MLKNIKNTIEDQKKQLFQNIDQIINLANILKEKIEEKSKNEIIFRDTQFTLMGSILLSFYQDIIENNDSIHPNKIIQINEYLEFNKKEMFVFQDFKIEEQKENIEETKELINSLLKIKTRIEEDDYEIIKFEAHFDEFDGKRKENEIGKNFRDLHNLNQNNRNEEEKKEEKVLEEGEEKNSDPKLLAKKKKYLDILENLSSKLKNVVKKPQNFFLIFVKAPSYAHQFKLSESAEGAVEFIDFFFLDAFLGLESLDEKIIRLFQAFFLLENLPYEKNISMDEMAELIKSYIKENNIRKFDQKKLNFFYLGRELEVIDQKIKKMDIKAKIKLEKLVEKYKFVISPSNFDTIDALSSVLAFVMCLRISWSCERRHC